TAMSGIARIVRHHHERYDGLGYPDRLAAAEVPLGARIIAVADGPSAMTNDRPYRRAVSLDEAWSEILRHSGTQFDPAVVEGFGSLIGSEIWTAADAHACTSAPR